ncbi:MAG: hypothetical protein IPI81_09890 [Flavobacteriales bacterium]|nr:hypothetical protein [Flavobacteriales bacterium]
MNKHGFPIHDSPYCSDILERMRHLSDRAVVFGLAVLLIGNMCYGQRGHGSAASGVRWTLPGRFGTNMSAAAVYQVGTDIFMDGSSAMLYKQTGGAQDPFSLSSVQGWPSSWTNGGVDAAFSAGYADLVLIHGRNMLHYDLVEQTMTGPTAMELPPTWQFVDGAAPWTGSDFLLTYGMECIAYNLEANTYRTIEKLNSHGGWPVTWGDGIDDVLENADGNLNFFRGGEVIIYDKASAQFIGTPASILEGGAGSSGTSGSASSWCALGAPSGGKEDGETKPNIGSVAPAGGPSGVAFTDQQIPGARLSEIRVWGKFIVNAIQVVLTTPDGGVYDGEVHGDPSGQPAVFKFEPEECLTAVSGFSNGNMGDYVYALQFRTTKRTSPMFGASTTRGLKTLSLTVPFGGSFVGFTGRASYYLSAIGLRYATFEKVAPVVVVAEAKGKDGGSGTGAGTANSGAGDEYTDDMGVIDAMDSVGVNSFGTFKQMPECQYITGYNLLFMDRLELCKGESKCYARTNPFIVQNTYSKCGPELTHFQPWGARVRSVGDGACKNTKTWVMSSEEMSKMTSWDLGVTARAAYSFTTVTGSLSHNSTRMNSSSTGSERIYLYNTCTITVEELFIDPHWEDEDGKKCRQRLSPKFRKMVEALPLPAFVPKAAPVRGQPMNSAIQAIRKQYENFLMEFGTHFPTHIVAGGIRNEETTIQKSVWQNSSATKEEWKASVLVDVQVGKTSEGGSGGGAGVSFGTNTETHSASGGEKGSMTTEIYSRGGTGSTTTDAWNSTVAAAPAPISMEMEGISTLLDPIFFPNDPKIAIKRAVLEMVMDQYILDNYKGLVPPGGDFFSDKKSFDCEYEVEVYSIHVNDADDEGSDNRVEVYGTLDLIMRDQLGTEKSFTTGPAGRGFWHRDEGQAQTMDANWIDASLGKWTVKGGCKELETYTIKLVGSATDSDPPGNKDDSLGKLNEDDAGESAIALSDAKSTLVSRTASFKGADSDGNLEVKFRVRPKIAP